MVASIKKTFLSYKKKILKLLGKDALMDIQLTKVGKKLFGHKYLGTFSQDKVPMNHLGYCIANVDTTGQAGSHWVSLVFTPHHCYIYDSFGRLSKNLLPILFEKLRHKKIIQVDSDPKPEQFGNTAICGQLALSFLLTVEKYGVEKAVFVL